MTALKIKGLVIKKISSEDVQPQISNFVVAEKSATIKNIFSVMKDFLLVGGDFA